MVTQPHPTGPAPYPAPERAAPAAEPRTVLLSQMRAGDCGRIHSTAFTSDESELLRAMGMCEDCNLRVCRSGSPCIVQVNTTRLGLSASMARKIVIAIEDRVRLAGV